MKNLKLLSAFMAACAFSSLTALAGNHELITDTTKLITIEEEQEGISAHEQASMAEALILPLKDLIPIEEIPEVEERLLNLAIDSRSSREL